MFPRVVGLFALGLVLASVTAEAACGDAPGDAAQVTAARAAIDATCPCDGFVRHSDYVKCARLVLAGRANAGQLNPACRGQVERCAARSTCGRAGAVTCCRTNSRNKTRCAIKRSADRCKAPSGGSACTGSFPSCCDACQQGGCVTPAPCEAGGPSCGGTCASGLVCTPTSDFFPFCGCVPEGTCTGPAPGTCGGSCPADQHCDTVSDLAPYCGCVPDAVCSGGPGSCGGPCPSGLTCAPVGDFPPYCGCVPDGSQPCGSAQQPFCNGQCPPGEECGPSSIVPGSACFCHPVGMTACGDSGAPTCGGVCSGTDTCQAYRTGSFDLCACAITGQSCFCVGGTCPSGEICNIDTCGCITP